MNIPDTLLSGDEKAVFALRSLYREHGFTQYKMNKFEEYDLYAENKDYLRSDDIITFTDTNGKLMALKPDVTLSIIKNCADSPDGIQKVYYNENVYRVSRRTRDFREIMQAGLECIGDVDDYAVYEVLTLAAESLRSISPEFILDISQLDIVGSAVDGLRVSEGGKKGLLKCIGEKNIHGITDICSSEGLDDASADTLRQLVNLSGEPAEAIRGMRGLPGAENFSGAVSQLERVLGLMEDSDIAKHIRIDFSVINDMNYYNGIVFNGFVEGIPNSILSGGQYDRLMHKMGLRSEAIGFAVYLDSLEYLRSSEESGEDADIVLAYEDGVDMKRLRDTREQLCDGGKRVLTVKAVPEKLRYKQIYHLGKNGVVTLG
jgi:ATP phosphoribosyltransferase regulatory subunit